MARAKRAPSAAPYVKVEHVSTGEPEPLPTAPRSSPEPAIPSAQPSEWEHWRLLAVATLGAWFGFLTGTGLYGELHDGSMEFALVAVVLGLAAYVPFDPAMEMLYDKLGAPRRKFREGRKVAAATVVALVTFIIAVLDHSLSGSMGDSGNKLLSAMGIKEIDGIIVAAGALFTIGLIAFFITHSWIRGARQQPPRAKIYGGLVGLVAGLLTGAVGVYLLRFKFEIQSQFWVSLAGIMSLGWFLGPGLLGGWMIDQRWDRLRPTARILYALAGFSAVYVVALLFLAHVLALQLPPELKTEVEGWTWLPVAAVVFQNLGWAVGLYLHGETLNSYLDSSSEPAARNAPSQHRNHGSVVEFPRNAETAEQPAEWEPARVRVQTLLLKPTGDRKWAVAALLLSLVTAGPAYYNGSLRRDPQIDNSVEEKFQKDFGSQPKALTVHSSGRVVTVSGVVGDEAEHAKAIQAASSVRGVKQVIDRIKIATSTTTVVAPPLPIPASATDATTSNGVPKGPDGDRAVDAQKSAKPPKAERPQKPVASAKAAPDSQKHHGLFHLPAKNTSARAVDAKKPPEMQKLADTQKTADTQKRQGFFHFLKRNKDQKDKNKNKDTKNKSSDGTGH